MPKVRLLQIFYDDAQRATLDDEVTPYKNLVCTKYFCSQIVADLIDRRFHWNCDYFGLLSWKCQKKTRLSPGRIKSFVETYGQSPDFFAVCGKETENVWTQAVTVHPPIICDMAQEVLRLAGWKVNLDTINSHASYCNYQIVKSDLYEDYVEQMLKPCIRIMNDEANPFLREMLNKDAKYRSQPPVATDHLRQITGAPYYTFHSFICERLFTTYAFIKQWSYVRVSG